MADPTRAELRAELVNDFATRRPLLLHVAVGFVLVIKYLNMVRDDPQRTPTITPLDFLRQVRLKVLEVEGEPRE